MQWMFKLFLFYQGYSMPKTWNTELNMKQL